MKSPHKALLTVIVEVGNYLSSNYQVVEVAPFDLAGPQRAGSESDIVVQASFKEVEIC